MLVVPVVLQVVWVVVDDGVWIARRVVHIGQRLGVMKHSKHPKPWR